MFALVLALGCGLGIGLILGTVGGGGSILAVPALVYVLGQSPRDATAISLVVIGSAAAIATVSYQRDRKVRWRVGAIFSAVGVPAAFFGSVLNRHVGGSVLLGSFAAVMAISGSAMVYKLTTDHRVDVAATPATSSTQSRWSVTSHVLVAALLTGFLTGFLGVGGGFIIVPALVMALRIPMSTATGTSLLIIAVESGVSLALHGGIQCTCRGSWIIVCFAVSAALASLAGKKIASRCSSDTMTFYLAIMLFVVAGGIGLQATVAAL